MFFTQDAWLPLLLQRSRNVTVDFLFSSFLDFNNLVLLLQNILVSDSLFFSFSVTFSMLPSWSVCLDTS